MNKIMKPVFALNVQANPAVLVSNMRVSIGTAIALGMLQGKTNAVTTTAYLMTYVRGKCIANCSFCPQARNSTSSAEMLSRISWPVFSTKQVLENFEKITPTGRIKRICIQALNYPAVFDHLFYLIQSIRNKTRLPISVSCQPRSDNDISQLAKAGVNRVGIPVDAATESIFDRMKGAAAGGPYRWDAQFKLLAEAVNILGKDQVSTHLIVGLGETEKDMIGTIQRCVDMSVLPALFAFTPISGTNLEREVSPEISTYRKIQLARQMVVHKTARFEDMKFDDEGCLIDYGVNESVVSSLLDEGDAFRTSGCPDCNRPFYNERPSGPVYNYPRKLTDEEVCSVRDQFNCE
jgi:biotin synthase-related radical SAM superfamily protein